MQISILFRDTSSDLFAHVGFELTFADECDCRCLHPLILGGIWSLLRFLTVVRWIEHLFQLDFYVLKTLIL